MFELAYKMLEWVGATMIVGFICALAAVGFLFTLLVIFAALFGTEEIETPETEGSD